MILTVNRTSDITWEVDSDDDDLHYVNFNTFKRKFVCDCQYNNVTEEDCKHIIASKFNLITGQTVFDENETKLC
jgi:hypothetical protein